MLDKIYIIHYTKLKERWRHMHMEMMKWFPKVPFEFIEVFDQEELTEKIIQENFEPEKYQAKFGRPFSRGEMSLCLKFKECFKRISSSPGEHFLVLEDDVVFKEDPLKYISRIVTKCNNENINFDCVFMGEAAMRVGDNRDVFFKIENQNPTNGLCTVLYKKDAATRLSQDLENRKITQAMDWQFNDIFKELSFDVYWGKAITKHGSVLATTGTEYQSLKSSLREGY